MNKKHIDTQMINLLLWAHVFFCVEDPMLRFFTPVLFSQEVQTFIDDSQNPLAMKELMESAFGAQGIAYNRFYTYFDNGGTVNHPDLGDLKTLCKFIVQEYNKENHGVNLVAAAISFGLGEPSLLSPDESRLNTTPVQSFQ